MIDLSNDSLLILKKCLRKCNSELLLIVENPAVTEHSSKFYNQLREIVGNELIAEGLNEDSEPNSYGILLENLIDEIGRLFL